MHFWEKYDHSTDALFLVQTIEIRHISKLQACLTMLSLRRRIMAT